MQEIPYDASHVPIEYDDPVETRDDRRMRREQRVSLEKDVAQLQKKLMVEVRMRNALNRGLSRPLGHLPRINASLPVETRELLLEVAVLEEEIISLEKQVKDLGREIESEVPVTDKETIFPILQFSSPRKANSLRSPSVSPKDSCRINSKPSISPWKSSDQKSDLAKPPCRARKIPDPDSHSEASSSPTKSLEEANSIKTPIALKDCQKPVGRITILVPAQKSQPRRNGLHPKVPLRNSRDFKSRRLSFPNKEIKGVSVNTVPFVPRKLSLAKDDNDSSPLTSPATGNPTDVVKTCPRPPRFKSDNDKTSTGGHAQLRKKDPINDKAAPKARTPRQTGKNNGPIEVPRTTSRQPLKHGTAARRIVGASTTSTMDALKSPPKPDIRCAPPSRSSNTSIELRNPVDADDGNISDIPSSNILDGDQTPFHVSPDDVEGSGPERDREPGTEQVSNPVFSLSEEVVMLLDSIYRNLHEEQHPLESDSGSSSQTSMSASVSSSSPDGYELRGGVNRKLRMDDSHSESFKTKLSTGMGFMGDCYPGEVADGLDPYSYLSKDNLNSRRGLPQKLMS